MSKTIYSNKISKADCNEQDETTKQKLETLKRELRAERMRERISQGKGVEGLKVYLMNYNDTTIRDALTDSLKDDKRLAGDARQQKIAKLLNMLSKYFTPEELQSLKRDCKGFTEREIDELCREFKAVEHILGGEGLQK